MSVIEALYNTSGERLLVTGATREKSSREKQQNRTLLAREGKMRLNGTERTRDRASQGAREEEGKVYQRG